MAKKPVHLNNGRSWPSRGAAIDYFRELRDRYPVGATISDPADHSDLMALLERYDMCGLDGPSKIGVGVDRFETRLNITNGGKNVGFWVIRLDGSETDFSFIRAVNKAPKGALDQLVDACRTAVQAELQSARIAYFAMHADRSGRVVCAISGDRISERDCGLEYAKRGFSELVGDFVITQGWQDGIPEGVLSAPADAQTTTSFASPSHAAAFREFHRTTARVRVVSKKLVRQRRNELVTGGGATYLEL
ncbi:DUF3223 domain-containing protein [Qipengyuania citrea]|uniref:DUF3223 domain-containing protein n=1 Tax=Qipengyuania citrea TaxID=225971 RepID=UPI0032996C3D